MIRRVAVPSPVAVQASARPTLAPAPPAREAPGPAEPGGPDLLRRAQRLGHRISAPPPPEPPRKPPSLSTARPFSLQRATRLDVSYNNGQGRLLIDVKTLAGKNQNYWESFPLDAYDAILTALDQAALEEGEQDDAELIRGKIEISRYRWTQAAAGKRLAVGYNSYATIRAAVGVALENQYWNQANTYRGAIDGFAPQALEAYPRLQAWVAPFNAITDETRAEDEGLVTETLDLFSWLIPLHDEVVTGLANKQGLMAGMKAVLTENIEILAALQEGRDVLPKTSVIRKNDAVAIQGQNVGKRSEIKTAMGGAIHSGEKASPRDLETRLTAAYHVPFVAGHLVADTLGGKDQTYNLTPMTNAFNTSGGMAGIKAAENDALGRLRAGKVIRYSTFVSYDNQASDDELAAVLPTRLDISVADLEMKGGARDSTKIENYTEESEDAAYSRTPAYPNR